LNGFVMSDDSFVERCGVQVLEGSRNVAEVFRYLASRRVRVVELNLNNPYFLAELSRADVRTEAADIARGEGMRWTVHLPEDTAVFFSVHDETFAGYLAWLVEFQARLSEAGCRAMTLHMGSAAYFAFSGQRRKGEDIFGDFYRERLRDRLVRAARLLGDGAPVCIENVGGFHLQWVRDILAEVGGFSYTMDIGHLKVAHPRIADAEFEFFKRFSGAIRVVHVHDNHGEWDEHLEVREPRALEPYLGLAKESDACVVMEVRPLEAAFASLAALTGVQR